MPHSLYLPHMCLRDTGGVEQQRANLDARIAALEAELLQLKGKRNELSVTARLPAELLEQIFLSYQQEVVLAYGAKKPVWMRITFVSKRWREVALAMPRLWDIISINWKTDLLQTMLHRSASFPFSLEGSLEGAYGEVDLEELRRSLLHAKRLRSVNLRMPGKLFEAISILASRPAPTLHSLTLQSSGLSNEIIRLDLFDGCTPELRHVAINRIMVDPRSSIFKGLTSLRLDAMLGAQTRPSCNAFLDALDACPGLCELHIHKHCPRLANGVARDSAFIDTQARTCRLPELKTVSIRDDICECAQLLSYLILPESTDITCEADVYPRLPNLPDETQYAQVLVPLLSRCQALPEDSSQYEIKIKISQGNDATILWNRLRIKVRCSEQEWITLQVVPICAALPLEQASSLTVLFWAGFDAGDWHAAFAHATALKEIHLFGGSPMRTLIGATLGERWCNEHANNDAADMFRG